MDMHVLLQSVQVGPFASGYKILALFIASLLWWRLLTWIDKDAPAARLPRELVNLGSVGAYALAFVLFLFLPGFWLAFSVFLVVLLASVGVYLAVRNQQVGLKDLGAELKSIKLFSGGEKTKKKKKGASEEISATVVLATRDGRAMHQPEDEAPERPAFDALQAMLADPLRRGMEKLDLAPQDASMVTQYWVDGVMYAGSQFNKTIATSAIHILKRLAGLDINEKRKPQSGTIQVILDGKRKDIEVQTAGSTVGESLRMLVDPKHRHDRTLDQLGMAPEQLQQLDTIVRDTSGIVLVAVPKGQGLTSLLYGLIRKHDAFLTHIHSIERDPEDDLEGITQNKLAKGASPNDELQQVQWVVSQDPDAILLTELGNPKSARELIAFAEGGKRAYIGLHAGSATDAIAEWRQIVGDDDLATRQLHSVISGRLVRKLCPACKQPYQPDAETLRKLNLDHGRAQQFFQARTQPLVDQKGNPIACTFCAEMRYHGRTGVFEVMQLNDEVRHAVMSNSTPNQLRALYRKMRGRFIQEYALDLVEKGETSVQEVLRAMRGQEQDPRAAKAASATGSFGAASTGTGTSAGTRSGSGSSSTTGHGSRPGRPSSPGRQ